jgi:hypothetical protein
MTPLSAAEAIVATTAASTITEASTESIVATPVLALGELDHHRVAEHVAAILRSQRFLFEFSFFFCYYDFDLCDTSEFISSV